MSASDGSLNPAQHTTATHTKKLFLHKSPPLTWPTTVTMKAKRFKSGGSGGGNDREQDRRSRAEIAARAAAANGRVVPSSDSAPTSEQVSVGRTHVCHDYIMS